MDIQTGLICVTVAILSAIVIYLISISTMKEKTYDEAMADLRKETEKQFSQGRAAKDKIKDKKDKKKAGKKVKEKSANSANSSSFEQSDVDGSNKNHVAFVEPEAAVLDDNVVVEEKKKTKKKEKPILLNKNEPNVVAERPVPILNRFEKIHPKDDFELKRSHSREEIVKNTSTSSDIAPSPSVNAKEQSTQKHNKQASKSSGMGASNVQNKAVIEQKVEKQQSQPSQTKQSQSKQQKQSEKSNLVKADKKISNNASVSSNSAASVINTANSDVKEDFCKQNVNKQLAMPVKQPSVTESNSPTPAASQQNSYNSEKLTSSPSIKISKKKKSELAALNQISGDRDGVNVSLLMPLVRKAELSKSEIQLLIDFLLNKQQGITDGSSEWIEGRQDPVLKLKKQLAEKEKALTDEVEANTGFQTRLKELRAELNAEKHNVRTLEEAIHARQSEISSFALKLQHAVDEKQTLAQQIQQLQSKLGEERLLVCKLQEEGAQGQSAFQQELLAQRKQLEMHIARLNETQLQQQETIATLEAQLGNQMQDHEALTGELALLQERSNHLQESASQAQDLARQMEELRSVKTNLEHVVNASKFDIGRLQTEINELSEELNRVRAENEKLTSVVQTVQNENIRYRETNERLTMQVSSACVEARQLRDENETLAAQVTASTERPATEGRENGDTNNYSENKLSRIEDQDDLQKKELILEEMSSQLKAKEIQVESLTSEVNSYKTEILEQQRLVQALKEEVVVHQKEAERLTNDLTQQKSKISNLIEQLDSQQAKNNDLRTKNWKVMEALSSTEKLLESKMKESDKLVNESVKSAVEKVLLEQQSSTRQLLQRVFPELVVPECKDRQEWFDHVEKALKNWKPQQPDNNESSSFVELEKQNTQLQAMVNHYKNIIADTEGMLNRLQSHVEQEEGKWGEELQALQSQLEAVTRERDALQQACSSGSIQKATNGFNHVDTASQTSSKHRRFTGWLRKRLGLTKLKKSSKNKKRHDSV